MSRILFATIIFLACCCKLLMADEVYLVNGDRITGKVKTMQDGKLTVESDLAGSLVVDINNVATFRTNEPVEVYLKDGTVLKKQISKAETGKISFEGDQTLKAQDFDVAAITAINPPAKEEPKWHGDISGALASTHGNTSILTGSFSANVTKRTEKDRSLLAGEYFYSEQKNLDTSEKDTTQDQWKLRGKYDYFFTKKMFGFLEGSYAKDRIAELDRRVIVGTGLGYQWIESEPFNFWTQAGIASRYEAYLNDSPNSSQLSAQVGYHLDKKLAKPFTFINDLTYYPSLERFSDYFLTTTAELRAQITEMIFTNFKAQFDFDATPAEGKGTTDVKYIWGVGVKF